jgi:peptidoglycan/LPS O-acetylase OafA/YrhL
LHWHRGGWVGVDLFFVLSGFLVSGLLFSEYRKFHKISPLNFLIRRGLKIYPSFWFMILTTTVVFLFQGGKLQGFFTQTLISDLLFIQSYTPGIWGHTWSLAVEEHFYLLLLLLFVQLSTKRAGQADPFQAVPKLYLFISGVCLTLRFLGLNSDYALITHLTPSHLRMDSLFAGVALAYFYHHHYEALMTRATRYRTGFFIAGLCALAPAFLFDVETTPFIYTAGFTLFSAGCVLILLAGVAKELPSLRVVKLGAYIGSHSYPIYLWHIPVFYALDYWLGESLPWSTYLFLYVPTAVIWGIAMSALLEFPVLKLRDRFFPSRSFQPT